MKIEIPEAAAVERTIRNRTTGKDMLFREQTGYASVSDRDGKPLRYPAKIVVPLAETQAPYAPGFYSVADESFFVDEYDKLAVARLKLVSLPGVKA